MIFFVAQNPHKVQKREGFLQRVMAVDGIFGDEKKVYINDLDDKSQLAQALTNADLIYVHSIYNAEKIIDYYDLFGHKIITDLHGVVPEEESLYGHEDEAQTMSQVEEKVFRCSNIFVAVTKTMADHFNKKYTKTARDCKSEWIILPIFEPRPRRRVYNESLSGSLSVIYAGGTQPWQKTDDMILAINSAKKKYNYTILTHDTVAFSGINKENTLKLEVKAVDSSKVNTYYQKADMGFVLRDDITVNRVACPTKLIEYIGNGVVPIVDSPRIGDFYNMGYKCITLSQFTNKTISQSYLRDAATINYKIFDDLQAISEKGSSSLRSAYEEMKRKNKFTSNFPKQAMSALISSKEEANAVISHLSEENDSLRWETSENQKIIDDLKTTISGMQNSKRWKITSKIAGIYSVGGRISKRIRN